MKSLNEIVNEYNYSVCFSLLGRNFNVSSERNIYRVFRSKYNNIAKECYNIFQNHLNTITDMDEFIESLPNVFFASLETEFNELSRDAISLGYYSVDIDSLISECDALGFFEDFKNIYYLYTQKDEEILSSLSSSKNYRGYRKDTRRRWNSITINGNMAQRWGNQFQAATMNAIEGAGHSFVNSIGNMVDEAEAEYKRKELLKNADYLARLKKSVYSCALSLHLVIIDILSNGNNPLAGGYVTQNEINEANSIHNNLANLQLTNSPKKECVYRILSLDPFNSEYYKTAINQFIDNGEEIIKIATFFEIDDIIEYVKMAITELAKQLDTSSPIGISNSRSDVLKITESLGVEKEYANGAIEFINQQGKQLLLNAFNQTINDTFEGICKCNTVLRTQKEIMNLPDIYSDEVFNKLYLRGERVLLSIATQRIGQNENDAFECKKLITELCQKMNLPGQYSKKAFQLIDKQLMALRNNSKTGTIISSTPKEIKTGKTLSILSLILGIISILTGCCSCFLGTGGIAAVAAIILGIIASKKYYLEDNFKRMKTIGILCGIVGVIMNMLLIMFIIYANLVSSNSNSTSNTTSNSTAKSYTNTSSSYGNTYSSYNQALDALAEGLTNSDGKAVYHTMVTDEIMDTITQEEVDSLSELVNTINSTFSATTGKKSEWSFKKSSSLKLSDSDIDSIKYFYSSHHGKSIAINQAYQVKAKMKYCGESDYVYINVIEVPNEGWKISEEFLNTVLGVDGYFYY